MLGKGGGEGEEPEPPVAEVPGDVEVVALLRVPAGREAEPVGMKEEAESKEGQGDGRQDKAAGAVKDAHASIRRNRLGCRCGDGGSGRHVLLPLPCSCLAPV